MPLTTREQTQRDNIWQALDDAPETALAVRAALVNGRVNGHNYYGECRCLLGTIAQARGRVVDVNDTKYIPAEMWFFDIQPGETPENNPHVATTVAWVDAWFARQRVLGWAK